MQQYEMMDEYGKFHFQIIPVWFGHFVSIDRTNHVLSNESHRIVELHGHGLVWK